MASVLYWLLVGLLALFAVVNGVGFLVHGVGGDSALLALFGLAYMVAPAWLDRRKLKQAEEARDA